MSELPDVGAATGVASLAWLLFALPALGAFVLARELGCRESTASIAAAAFTFSSANALYVLWPLGLSWALLPLVILATMATVIASQAVISGAFSMMKQAVRTGLLPRLEILHTSENQEGQIYLPKVNAILAVGVFILVILFGSSSNLAAP